ncbi:MAG: PD40 domain-containing protein [Anaerolineae bacterium]|nr:PD40 domain-containing protein [Anaerolineae bacterium]
MKCQIQMGQWQVGLTALLLLGACNRADVPPALLPTRTPVPLPANFGTPTPPLPDCSAEKLDLSAPPLPSSPSNGQIGYITLDGNIAVMDATGRDVKDITVDANLNDRSRDLISYRFPTFAHDGKHIAFVGIRSSARTQGMTQTLYVAPVDTRPKISAAFATADANIPYFDWSPDDQRLAVLSINPTSGSIKVISRTTGTTNNFDDGTTVYWHWRPDSGAMMAHLGGSIDFNHDAKLSLGEASSPARKLSTPPGDFQAPQFSPNGKYILVVAHLNGDNQLIVLEASGAPLCKLAALTNGGFFAWSPDGKRVALMDTISPVFEPAPLDLIDIASGKRTRVHELATAFFWSPNGQRLAVYSVRSAVQNGGLPNDLVGVAQSASGSLDINAVPLLRIESFDVAANKAIFIADTLPTRDFISLLGYFDQYSRAVTPWSPDGNKLVLTALSVPRETADIAVANLASPSGVEVKPVGSGSLAFWSSR